MGGMLGVARGFVVPLSVLLSVALPFYFAAAAFGTKFGLWTWQFALGVLTRDIGPLLMMIAAALGLLSVVLAFGLKPRALRLAALVALAVPVGGLLYANQVGNAVRALPPIHDIATNPEDPPVFSAETIAMRGADANPVLGPEATMPQSPLTASIAGKTLGEIQAAAYPDITTIEVSVGRAAALSACADVLDAMGLELIRRDEVLGTLEATATSFWFGFKDDVVVRVRPSDAGGALIDVRSVSRVGVSDMGANAKRIRAFRDKLKRIIT